VYKLPKHLQAELLIDLACQNISCWHCKQPVTKDDLLMWASCDTIKQYFVHRYIVNPQCDKALTKYLNDKFPDNQELTIHIAQLLDEYPF